MKNPAKFASPAALLAFTVYLFAAGHAAAQIYVTNESGNTIGKYNLDGTPVGTGTLVLGITQPAAITAYGSNLFVTTVSGTLFEFTTSGTQVGAGPLLTGLGFDPLGLSISGTNIFVSNIVDGTVGLYTTSGATVNTSLISSLDQPFGLATTSNHLFVAEGGTGTIDEFDFSGNLIGTGPLISGLNNPTAIAIYGSDIFIANYGDGTIGEYNLDGTPVGTGTLISGLTNPSAISVSGSLLYVASKDDSVINSYDLFGNSLGSPLISGLQTPFGISVVPEPSTWALLTLGVGLLFFHTHRRRSKPANDE